MIHKCNFSVQSVPHGNLEIEKDSEEAIKQDVEVWTPDDGSSKYFVKSMRMDDDRHQDEDKIDEEEENM